MRILTCCLCLLPVCAQPAGKVEWKPFSPKDGAFTVQLPATPEEHKKPIATPQGMLDLIYYEAEVPGRDGKLLVGFTEFPAASIKAGSEDKRLDHARDGAVASTKGKLVREKSLLLDGYPGRELEIEIEGKARVIVRMYAVKNRLYQLVAAGNPEFVDSADAAKFLTSLKLAK